MTREEAIKKLEWALKNNTIYDVNEALEYILAVKKGIEALSAEPCEDCISRAEALKSIGNEFLSCGDGSTREDQDKLLVNEILANVYESVKSLPSIQPKPMQVELEGDGYADNGQIYYDYGKCPKCGWEFEDGDKDWEEPYCCHCGQKLHWFESEE